VVELSSLWLPIVVSSLAVFFAGFLTWMVLPVHQADWRQVPEEANFLEKLKGQQIPPGNYMFPFASDSREMNSPEYKAKTAEGPTGTLQVWDAPCSMGRNLICQYLYLLAVSFCLGYLATMGPELGARFIDVFRFVSTAAFLTYTAAIVPNAIWFKSRIAGHVIDGIVFGLVTGAVFAMLWPTGPTL